MKINSSAQDTFTVSITEKDGSIRELAVPNEVIYQAPKKGEPFEKHIQWDMSKIFHEGRKLLTHHTFSNIYSYWNENKNKQENILISEHDCYSTKQVWWTHSVCNHDYKLSAPDRMTKEPDCELCKLVSNKPLIITNWNTDKNGTLSCVPSYDSMLSWKCNKCNKDFDRSFGNYLATTYCPHCKASDKSNRDAEKVRIKAQKELEPKLFGTSHIERQIFYNLKCIFGENIVYSGRRINKMEIDIYIPSIGVAIEYDGVYFHREKFEADRLKNEKLKVLGINLLRIREKGLDRISPEDIIYDYTKNDLNKLFNEIYSLLLKNNMLNKKHNVDFLRYLLNDINKIVVPANYFSNVLSEESIGANFPHIAKEFLIEQNGNIDLFNVKKGSKSIIGIWWWKCQYCGFEFQKSMESRINICGCMRCGMVTKNTPK